MRTTTFAICLLILSACVSVKLATEDRARVAPNKIHYDNPGKPFKKTDLSQADGAWQSPSTGNSISFFSDCKANTLPLKVIRTNTFSGVEALKVIDEVIINYNDREALRSIVLGKMEGVPIKINLIIFKKNMCTYSLSYIALIDQYNKELTNFTKFTESFKVYD